MEFLSSPGSFVDRAGSRGVQPVPRHRAPNTLELALFVEGLRKTTRKLRMAGSKRALSRMRI
jgi:hypothetical protein